MLLAIDTSGAVSAAVLATDGAVLAARTDERARHHDEVLLGLIDHVLREARGTRSDLTGVIVGRGPGPFTGLRVGLVVAGTLAAALGIELTGLGSLDGLALQAAQEDPAARSIAVALDARRHEIYHARYRARAGRIERTSGPAVSAPDVVAEELASCDAVAGSGAALYPHLLHPTSTLVHVDAGALGRQALIELATGADLGSTEPLYLRAPDAKKPARA